MLYASMIIWLKHRIVTYSLMLIKHVTWCKFKTTCVTLAIFHPANKFTVYNMYSQPEFMCLYVSVCEYMYTERQSWLNLTSIFWHHQILVALCGLCGVWVWVCIRCARQPHAHVVHADTFESNYVHEYCNLTKMTCNTDHPRIATQTTNTQPRI